MDMTKSPPDVQVLRETEIPGFDRSHYNVEQVFYNSKDGTRVPMFIASRKDLKRDGSEPCMLYGKKEFLIILGLIFSGFPNFRNFRDLGIPTPTLLGSHVYLLKEGRRTAGHSNYLC